MLIDLNQTPKPDVSTVYDVCICGSGPAGVTVARTLAEAGKRVALLEGGDLNYTEQSQQLYEGKSVGIQDWNAVRNARLRFLGGTSNHWSGMCSYFQESDFAETYHDMPGWPIKKAEVFAHFEAAKKILDLPVNAFQSHDPWQGRDFIPFVWEMSSPTRFNSKYLNELKNSSKIDLFVNANLTKIPLADNLGAVTAFEVSNYKKQRVDVRARQFVLALGSIENARMLLANNNQINAGLGNTHDMVGRCYMEHLNIAIGRFVVDKPEAWQHGGINIQPSADLISKKRIGNGVLSFNPNARPKSHGRTRALKQVLRNMVCQSNSATEMARKMVDFDCEGDGVITSMIEQSPNRNSRVTLDSEKDIFGIPKVVVNWQIQDFDARTIRTLGLEAAREMAKLGIARLQLSNVLLDAKKSISEIGIHSHQMGTTRMSTQAKHGVVDEQLKVHGLDNLYVAGSSVFPTGGGCNPTFTVVMLALRLGHYLSRL